MIQSVRIRNVKTLRHLDIGLERLTVFVGANGCGKTAVLEAIHNAVRAAMGDPRKVFAHERHGDWIYTRGGTGELSIACVTPKGEFAVFASPPPGYPPPPDLLQKQRWDFRVRPPENDRQAALDGARRLVFLKMNAATLAMPSYSKEDPPRMSRTGEGLASVLAYMLLNSPEGFEQLETTARELIPRLRRIRFRKALVHKEERELVRFGNETVDRRMVRKYRGELILFDFDHAENVSARCASEGTLLMLGLLTTLLGPARPQIVLLDDIEHGLHPLAQRTLLAAIDRVMERFPDLQILATAHSPYLLDCLKPEQVRIVATGEDGYSICGRLTDHPQYAAWKEEMAPGELWSLFGETWLADGAPAP